MDNFAEPVIMGGEAECARGHTFRREAGFPYYTLGCMLSGRVLISFAEEEFEAQAVSLSLTPPDTPYTLLVPESHRELWLFFSPRPAWRPWLNWERRDGGTGDSSSLRLMDRRIRAKIIRGMRNALEYSQSPLPVGARLAELALEQVLVLAASLSASGGALDERLKEVLRALRHDLAHPWRESDLAGIATLSISRFAHLFREKLGVSPLRYLEQLRMEKARNLLLSTAVPVKTIAAMVGYPDALHFSRRFRSLVGRSPQTYRRQPDRCRATGQWAE